MLGAASTDTDPSSIMCGAVLPAMAAIAYCEGFCPVDSQRTGLRLAGTPIPSPREGSHGLSELDFGSVDPSKHLVRRHGASGGGIRVLCWVCLGRFIFGICPRGRGTGPFAAAGWVGVSGTAHFVQINQAGRGQGAARGVRGIAGALDA